MYWPSAPKDYECNLVISGPFKGSIFVTLPQPFLNCSRGDSIGHNRKAFLTLNFTLRDVSIFIRLISLKIHAARMRLRFATVLQYVHNIWNEMTPVWRFQAQNLTSTYFRLAPICSSGIFSRVHENSPSSCYELEFPLQLNIPKQFYWSSSVS